MRSTLRSTRHSLDWPLATRNVRSERGNLEIVLDVNGEGVGDLRGLHDLSLQAISGLMLIEKPRGKVVGNTFSRVAIPEFRNTSLFSTTGKDHGCFSADCRDVATHHGVGALFDGNRTFGIFA